MATHLITTSKLDFLQTKNIIIYLLCCNFRDREDRPRRDNAGGDFESRRGRGGIGNRGARGAGPRRQFDDRRGKREFDRQSGSDKTYVCILLFQSALISILPSLFPMFFSVLFLLSFKCCLSVLFTIISYHFRASSKTCCLTCKQVSGCMSHGFTIISHYAQKLLSGGISNSCNRAHFHNLD